MIFMDRILTITIPAYNAEAFLAQCLDSLLSCEASKETELLVIDDGSTDRTGTIADGYAERYPDIVRVIHKENGGHGSGINTGIAAAGGKYFRVVDSDDTVDPKAYESYLKKLKCIDSDVIVTPFVRVMEGSRGCLRHPGRKSRGGSQKDSLHRFVRQGARPDGRRGSVCPKELLLPAEGSNGLPRGKVFAFEAAANRLFVRMHELTVRTSILREHSVRLSEHSFYVDMQLILFPIPWIQTCCLLDLPVYRYRLGDAGQSVAVRNMQKNRRQHHRVLRSLADFYRKRAKAGDSPPRLAYLARGIAKMQANQVQIALSLPVCRAAKRELVLAERWLARECPAAYAANEKKSIGLLRRSGWHLYGAAAAAWRLQKRRD